MAKKNKIVKSVTVGGKPVKFKESNIGCHVWIKLQEHVASDEMVSIILSNDPPGEVYIQVKGQAMIQSVNK